MGINLKLAKLVLSGLTALTAFLIGGLIVIRVVTLVYSILWWNF